MNLPEAPKHHLFVSHVTEDRVAAMEIVDALERRGVKCWITPRDVRPGRFDDQISDAIDHCSALLLIFSDRCNESDYIYREVTVAGEARKPVLPLRIEDCVPRRGLRLRLMDIHWIDAFAARQEAIETIIRTVGVVDQGRGEGVVDPDRASDGLASSKSGAPSAEEGDADSEPEAGAPPVAPRPPSELAGVETPGAASGLLSSAATVAPPEVLPDSPAARPDRTPPAQILGVGRS